MSEQWLGLHNEQWHQGYSLALNATRCENPRRGACFDEWCAPDKPCRCCLAAEVETLREQVTSDGVRCAKCEGVPAEMGGGDTGLPIGEAVTGEWTRCHDQACIRECEEGCCSGVISALTIERDVLREKVQRVERLLDRCDQDTYDFHWGEGSPVVLTQYVRDALDGGEPDE